LAVCEPVLVKETFSVAVIVGEEAVICGEEETVRVSFWKRMMVMALGPCSCGCRG
jgi:hypothetical protein